MELWNRPLNRLLCAEALEGRWLLSAAAPSNSAGIVGNSPPVEVVGEVEPDDGDEDDAEIDASELPARVVTALNARFPGASIEEAEMDEEDGQTEYSVTAVFGGKMVEVTFAPSGTVLEVEEPVSSAALPAALREWLESEYPGAVVDEAAVITSAGEPTYELTFAQPGGEPLEATLIVRNAAAADEPSPVTTPSDIASVAFSDATVPDSAVDAAAPSETVSAAQAVQNESAAPSDEDDELAQAQHRDDEAAALPAWIVEAGQARVAEALASLALGAGAGTWLPELADAMVDVLPVNVSALEQRMQHVLGEIDQLALQSLSDKTPAGAAMRLAIIVSLVAGVQLLLLDRKLRKGGPVRVFSA